MTNTKQYDTLAECEAFIEGMQMSGHYELCRPEKNTYGKWQVRYWTR
jgi:hypothetical protein